MYVNDTSDSGESVGKLNNNKRVANDEINDVNKRSNTKYVVFTVLIFSQVLDVTTHQRGHNADLVRPASPVMV